MSVKSIYLSHERLIELKKGLFNINNDLYETLNHYLECNNNDDGEYLINIFNDYELLQLEKIDEEWKLFVDVDSIYKAR